MKIGWCLPMSEGALIRRAGLDFVEVPVAPLGLENQSGLAAAKLQVADCPVPIDAFGSLFPPDMKVVGPSVDRDRIVAHLARIAELVVCAEAKIVVFGDGAARSFPDGFDRARADEQYLSCLAWGTDALKGTGATLVIEPLNRKRSNLVNSLAEAVRCAKLLDHPNVGVVADFYHMQEEQEPLSEIVVHKDWIVHFHLADTDRRNPGSGHYCYGAFASQLKSIDYTGRLTVECIMSNPEAEMRFSTGFLRGVFGY